MTRRELLRAGGAAIGAGLAARLLPGDVQEALSSVVRVLEEKIK